MIRYVEPSGYILTAVMSVVWLSDPTNAIYGPVLAFIGALIGVASTTIRIRKGKTSAPVISAGGKGGNASVKGSGTAIGGKGGGGGPGGKGGDGGNAHVDGDGFAMGGEGGEAGQLERGGRGGRSPLEILGFPNITLPDGSKLWEYGRGGDGGDPQ